MTVRCTRLGNGVQVVTEEMPGSHSATLSFWVDAGSRDESPPEWGASHFLEHLLFKGTDTRSARDIAEAIEAVGGDMNAFTTKEYTAFYTRLIDEDLELGLDILCDIMEAPAFRADEVESERQVILEEINMHEDEPSDLVHEVFHETIFPGHPLGREVLGERRTITEMTPEQIRSYFETRYRPDRHGGGGGRQPRPRRRRGRRRAPLLGAGRRRAGPRRARPGSSPHPAGHPPQHRAGPPHGRHAGARPATTTTASPWPCSTSSWAAACPAGCSRRSGRSGAWCTRCTRTGPPTWRRGPWRSTPAPRPGKAHEVLDLIDAELEKLVDGQVTDRELEVARGPSQGVAGPVAGGLGRPHEPHRPQPAVHGDVLSFEELVERTQAVGRDDVRRVVERVLAGERTLAVVGPFTEDDFAARVA